MSKKRLSPTAKLLRNSRVFSLPPTLAQPYYRQTPHAIENQVSDTQTLPYPIQQAIVTTPTSLARGDWGLKRSLPKVPTTRTSTPLVRINAMDTREHITDYSSASDLTLTLRKFQELNMPITNQKPRDSLSGTNPYYSVFEDSVDNTALSATAKNPKAERWRFGGPNVYGIMDGEFAEYMEKIKPRRAEFRTFLKEHFVRKRKADAARRAREDGRAGESPKKQVMEPTAQEFDDYVQSLRKEFSLGSELAHLIIKFLDLPPIPASNFMGTSLGDKSVPPNTHPSAGLSYIRSDAYLDNHPILGPQARRAPVEGRLLSGSYASTVGTGMIGVAGIVAHAPSLQGRERSTIPTSEEQEKYKILRGSLGNPVNGMGINTDGGSRIWVEPSTVMINPSGRIKLSVVNADRSAIGVHTGEVAAQFAPRPARQDVQPLVPSSGESSARNAPSTTTN